MTPIASPETPSRRVVVTALGIAQLLGWGTTFYFPAVLAGPIVANTGWPLEYVVGGTSIGLLVAGLISPRVGRLVDRHGGRPVLATGSLLNILGLVTIGLAPNLIVYLCGWVIVGAGMGSSLYDAAFAALGRLYGDSARGPITSLTLFGGFASTVCWPLGAFLVETFDWRVTCFAYAALHLCIALPLQLVMPRDRKPVDHAPAAQPAAVPAVAAAPNERILFGLLALVLTLAAGVGAVVIVHLLIFLQARGVDYVVAVSLGTLFGPAQVGARFVERLFGQHYHPVWTMIAACVGMAIGMTILSAGASLLAVAIMIYAAGYGISWIARGTLPLVLFGAVRYPALMGRLAFPSLIVQALAPSLGAFLLERQGVDTLLTTLTALTLLNVVLVGALWWFCRAQR